MSHIVRTTLVVLALIHLLPLLGVLGPARLSALYGVDATEPNLQLLLRHRAVLFGLLGAFLLFCAWRPGLQGTGLLAAGVSVISFLLLAALVGPVNGALSKVVLVDTVALAPLALGGAAYLLARRA